MYDVIVIGAGPTGCTAAKVLSERGLKVLLIEKCRLPRYKSCSGMIIKKTADLVNSIFGESIPLSVTCEPSENKGMIFTNDRGQEYRFEQSGLNVWRSSFDGWLAKKAEESGADVADRTYALSCTLSDDHIELTLKNDRKTYTAETRYLIDCEGGSAAFKSKIIPCERSYITTFQTFNEGCCELDYHYFHAYLQPELSEYDAWFNVKDNLMVLGVAVRDIAKIDGYYNSFISYMKLRHGLNISAQLKSEKWIMPQIRPDFKIDHGCGRVLFAGEAAGFLNPMGEGISSGIESGFYAANAIIDNFANPSSALHRYIETTKSLKSYMARQWSFVGKMTDTFSEFSK